MNIRINHMLIFVVWNISKDYFWCWVEERNPTNFALLFVQSASLLKLGKWYLFRNIPLEMDWSHILLQTNSSEYLLIFDVRFLSEFRQLEMSYALGCFCSFSGVVRSLLVLMPRSYMTLWTTAGPGFRAATTTFKLADHSKNFSSKLAVKRNMTNGVNKRIWHHHAKNERPFYWQRTNDIIRSQNPRQAVLIKRIQKTKE